MVSLAEWMAENGKEAFWGFCALMATVVQVSPLKINPWSWLGEVLGRFLGIKEIKKSLDNHIQMDDERNVKQCRMRILRFSDEILQGKPHTKEHYDEVLDDITEYERYCDTHPGYKNSKAGMAIRNIEARYQLHLRDRSFLSSAQSEDE